LLHLYLLDANGDRFAVFRGNAVMVKECDLPIPGERSVVLRDLVPCRLILVEVMLPIKMTRLLNIALESYGGT
jgi:hypothetical protein